MKAAKTFITSIIILFLTFSTIFSETDTIFFDDFETSLGWVRNPFYTDDATTGMWERDNPEESIYDVTMQLGTTVSGEKGLCTGHLAGSYPGSYDIDYGKTTVRSPDITLPSDIDITLRFSYYFAHYSNATSDDYLRVKVVGSTTQLVLEELGAADIDEAVWETFSISLNDFSGQTIYILIEAADEAGASLVEAGIEDVLVEKITTPGPQDDHWEPDVDDPTNDIVNSNTGKVYIGKKNTENYFEFDPNFGVLSTPDFTLGPLGVYFGNLFVKSSIFANNPSNEIKFSGNLKMEDGYELNANNITAHDVICTGEGSKLSASQLEVSSAKVHGVLFAKEITVTLDLPPDYVFENDYNLKSLDEVEKYIDENKHLPGIPSAKEIKTDGFNLGDMQAKLLEKIEEMTLHMIKMQKRIDELEAKQNESK